MMIAIVDDIAEDRRTLHTILDTYLTKTNISATVSEFTSAESFLKQFDINRFDICFMDIFMTGMSGMDASRIIYSIDPHCLIIFLTTSPDFLSEGYDVRAWRYLMKPIQPEPIIKALETSLSQLNLHRAFLSVYVDRKIRTFSFQKIVCVLSINRHTEVHTLQQNYKLSAYQTYSEIIYPLQEDEHFLLCSRGVIINLAHVAMIIDDCFLMRNGERLPISRRKFSDVKNAYLDYQINHL